MKRRIWAFLILFSTFTFLVILLVFSLSKSFKFSKSTHGSQRDEIDVSTFQQVGDSLVNDLGSSIFECTGSCYCEGKDRRSISTAQRLSTGLVYIVSSLTSYIAYRKSKSYFQEVCEENFSEVCELSSIASETDSCMMTSTNKKAKKVTNKMDWLEKTYKCYGRCVPIDGNLLVEIGIKTGNWSFSTPKDKKRYAKMMNQRVKKAKCKMYSSTADIPMRDVLTEFSEASYKNDDKTLKILEDGTYDSFIEDLKIGEKSAISHEMSDDPVSGLHFVYRLFIVQYLAKVCSKTVDPKTGARMCEPFTGASRIYLSDDPKIHAVEEKAKKGEIVDGLDPEIDFIEGEWSEDTLDYETEMMNRMIDEPEKFNPSIDCVLQ